MTQNEEQPRIRCKGEIISVVKKNQILFFAAFFLSISLLFPQETKVRVAVSRAPIYAEAHSSSYRIETLKKGTVLILFGSKQSKEGWLYINYLSPRWKSRVTGFIQADLVEEISEEDATVPKIHEEQPEEKQEIIPEAQKAEPKPIKPEVKELPVRVERSLGLTVLPAREAIPFPLSFLIGKGPRAYEAVEPEEPIVTTKEELAAAKLPAGADRTVQAKDKIDTKLWKEEVVIPEKTEVPKTERAIRESDRPLETKQTPEQEKPAVSQEPPKISRLEIPRREPVITLSLGYGPSLGGFGGFIQINTAASLSVHWGVGYYPTTLFYPEFDWVDGKVMYSAGIKYYLPWRTALVRPYVDLQYGGLSVEAVRVVKGIWFYTYVYEDIQKILWGPSLLAGLELRIGTFGVNGALGVSYVVTKWEYWDQPLFVTADISFLYYF